MDYSSETKKLEFIFDEVAKKVSSFQKDITSFEKVIAGLDLKGKSVLEVGCGIGDNLLYCAQNGAVYLEGFDISGERIKIAVEKAKKLQNIFFHKCSIEEYSTEKHFDIIVVWGTFEYVDNPMESLQKILTFLSEKGDIVLLISKPIFIKRVSVVFRTIFKRTPKIMILPICKVLSIILLIFQLPLRKPLYLGKSHTYTLQQTILEGLMVPRYNLFDYRVFSNYLQQKNFYVEFFKDVSPSMIGMIARR